MSEGFNCTRPHLQTYGHTISGTGFASLASPLSPSIDQETPYYGIVSPFSPLSPFGQSYVTPCGNALEHERSYVLQTLHRHDQRALRLLARKITLQDTLPGVSTERKSRRLRKQLELVQASMAENAHQERLALGRLHELYIEIRERERWNCVQQQQGHGVGPLACPAVAPLDACQHDVYDPARMALSPLSPAFVPMTALQTDYFGAGAVAAITPLLGSEEPVTEPPAVRRDWADDSEGSGPEEEELQIAAKRRISNSISSTRPERPVLRRCWSLPSDPMTWL